MTDTEIKRREAICKAAGVNEIDDVSDGFHTFRQLYYQRMVLFATIVKQNKDSAWKSLRHEDGELCFGGGWFIVGIDTPEGSYTYHYEDTYFSLFDCEELECGKHWDGHTEKDVTRLLSLPSAQSEIIRCKDCDWWTKQEDSLQGRCELMQIHHTGEWFCANAEQPKKGGWNFIGDNMFECSMCGVLYTTEQLNSLRNYDTDPYLPRFCPHCGCDMRGK